MTTASGAMASDTLTLNIRDLVRFLVRGLPLALLVALLAAGAVYALWRNVEPRYRTHATVLASQTSAAFRNFNLPLITATPVDPSIYRAAVFEGTILNEARQALAAAGLPEHELRTLPERIRVDTEIYNISSLIHLQVESSSPENAALAANALAEALLLWDKARAARSLDVIIATLENQLSALDVQIRTLQTTPTEGSPASLTALLELRNQRLSDLNTSRALRNSAVGLLEPFSAAPVPIAPIPTSLRFAVALAFAFGLLSSYVALVLRTALDSRFRSSEEIARATGLPVLAEFPVQVARRPHRPREAANYLRTNLLFGLSASPCRVILISSAVSNREKAGIAINLAESFARGGYRTLLVDADLRKPTLGQAFTLNPALHTSLQACLEHPDRDATPSRVVVGHAQLLDVIAGFTPAASPLELLTQGFPPLLARWRTRYDTIIIDGAPLLEIADSLILAPHVTGVVLATSLRHSDQRHLSAALELLKRIEVPILGLTVTGGNERGSAYRHARRELPVVREKAPPQPIKRSPAAVDQKGNAKLRRR